MSKDKDKRLEEKEKLEAEAQRSYAVAEMKKAHRLIEETEKERKRSSLLSICKRISLAIEDIRLIIKLLMKYPLAGDKITFDPVKNSMHGIIQGYESIHYDFQRSMEIRDEDMVKLFPRIEVLMESGRLASSCFLTMMQQLEQMRIYCQRMLY